MGNNGTYLWVLVCANGCSLTCEKQGQCSTNIDLKLQFHDGCQTDVWVTTDPHLSDMSVIKLIPGVVLFGQDGGCVMSTTYTAHVIHHPIQFVCLVLQWRTPSETWKILKAVKTIQMKTQELLSLAFSCNSRGTSTQQSDLKCDMVL